MESNLKKTAAIEMLKQGLSISEAATKLGVSRQAVSVWNKQAGDVAIKRGRVIEGAARTPPHVILTPINERIEHPAPEQIRIARTKVGLTQEQAISLVKSDAPYQVWRGYEDPVSSLCHRRMPLASWELFLLMIGEHPLYEIVARKK